MSSLLRTADTRLAKSFAERVASRFLFGGAVVTGGGRQWGECLKCPSSLTPVKPQLAGHLTIGGRSCPRTAEFQRRRPLSAEIHEIGSSSSSPAVVAAAMADRPFEIEFFEGNAKAKTADLFNTMNEHLSPDVVAVNTKVLEELLKKGRATLRLLFKMRLTDMNALYQKCGGDLGFVQTLQDTTEMKFATDEAPGASHEDNTGMLATLADPSSQVRTNPRTGVPTDNVSSRLTSDDIEDLDLPEHVFSGIKTKDPHISAIRARAGGVHRRHRRPHSVRVRRPEGGLAPGASFRLAGESEANASQLWQHGWRRSQHRQHDLLQVQEPLVRV